MRGLLRPEALPRQRGAALLLVVLIIALLAILVVEFQREARLELRAAANLRDTLQGHALARSGVAVGHVLLLEDLDDPERGKYDARDEDWNLEMFPVPLASPDGSMSAVVDRLEDLDGKFPLGALVNRDGIPQPRFVQAFERLLEVLAQHLREEAQLDILDQADIPALVDAVVDWMDADGDGDFEISEEFTVPNSRISHLEDLQRVEGFGVVPEGYPRPIADVVLPYLDTRSNPEVNVNTAEPPVLAAMHPDISHGAAVSLYEELGEQPAVGKFQTRSYPSVADITVTGFTLPPVVVSDRFRVALSVDVRGAVQQAEAILLRDRDKRRVETVEWREGWVRPQWRPAFGAVVGGAGLLEGAL